MITVKVNGEEKQLPSDTQLAQLVEILQQEAGQEPDPALLATAVNEVFIPRQQRADYRLKEQDEIFTFSPITGG
ncbi:sulfur carrier protein ThiS [Oligella ureolytica]|nr:sulfur carrier protein ThiS [Alcaligenaceae bacterium]HZJ96401.1 sulfur carrier protein ThiS [Oligella sp.]